jgi:dihydropteroate synthase
MIFRACHWNVQFPRAPLVMGILNVTPDSFSDGGQFLDQSKALEHAIQMRDEGADIIDIGGESTRPRAEPVPEAVELKRVIPVIQALKDEIKIPISIDTQKPAVAKEALAAGAVIVNDIAANRPDRSMWEIVSSARAGYILMHMQGTPQTMSENPAYKDVVSEVGDFFRSRLEMLRASGVNAEQIILDPGIGFGKNCEHNLQLLANLNRFTIYQRPVLVGASRKSFIGKLLGGTVSERLPGSLACAIWAALNGVQFIRTHDVAATVQSLRMIGEIQKRHQP